MVVQEGILVDHAILNAFVLHKSVISPYPRKYTQKFQRMELSYALTAPFLANRIGQGRSPSDSTLKRLKGKHFPYYHNDRKRCVVCGYKRKGPFSKNRKDTKTKNYCIKCVMELVLSVITHL